MTSTLAPRKRTTVVRAGDRIFSGLSTGAGVLILVVLAGVAAFLTLEGIPGILASPDEVKSGQSFWPYVWPLVYGTLIAATVALIIATPVAVGVALFISHYSPRRLGQVLGYLVDLLAAVPSVVYGLWGIQFLAPHMAPVYAWLAEHAGFIPFFAGPASATGRTIMTACIVLAVMILPIMTAICREIFLQTPRLHEEAALALGATRWEMARLAIFPYARSGIVSAAMLGLGRALGETLAVAMVLSVSAGTVTANLISSSNPSTIAANIALKFGEASGKTVNVLIASGLVLFVITFLVNFAARSIVDRRKDFSGAN
ncbi:phosphate ABC transporter permease subunit PstC [Aeromicrobium chenweiae]|uniref:Phosphate transport system permease protein n=1 Tax=Aeromicrobium chenweiae TaxID=2079793 RepID=A0A2S0WIL2_9ACTN|nr:phosphate ABC transporter permease subunit PstC [Aeromicrobium chenweiae]AWB91179.1 phosphate ABC transporter permease subunit PstC [Aeromicrobium chenweiae]TGN31698.1 phosphate ABC transporter permease subunit PstC [Aeromicrobium chenweiae]